MNIKHNISIVYKMLLYDFLYFAADLLIKLRNPCEIHQIDYDVLLLPTDKKITMRRAVCISNGPCCEGCRYLGDNGCTTKCLRCKLWVCYKASVKHPKLPSLLKKITIIASRQTLLWLRDSREETYQFLKKSR